MNFLKTNKLFAIFLGIFFCNFIFLQFISCNSTDEIDSILSSISKDSKSIDNLKDELLLYDGLEKEMEFAIDDLEKLSSIEKNQNRFWTNILNTEENIYTNFKDKSSESINADLTKLYSNLRKLCTGNNILFDQPNSDTFDNFGGTNSEPEKKFGFGLMSYDGFWPSFSKSEAKLLGVQSEIISSLIEFLSNSSDEKYSITLNKITREPVGAEDSQHISEDKLSVTRLDSKLIRSNLPVSSFAFTISFKSHTSHARTFINQLRPPFLIRDLKVERPVSPNLTNSTSLTASPFSEEQEETEKQLPIVNDVESTFFLLIEYVYKIDRDFETFILENFKGMGSDLDQDVLTTLFESSGHSKSLSKLQKVLKKRENN